MIKNKGLWASLLGIVALVTAVELWGPKPIDWSVSLDPDDKIPYGTFVLQNELERRYNLHASDDLTFYEITKLDETPSVIFALTQELALDSLDSQSLFDFAAQGGTVFLSAWEFSGLFADTLNLETTQNFILGFNLDQGLELRDSVTLGFVNPHLNPEQKYYYKSPVAEAHFTSIDTANVSVVAINDHELPVLLYRKWGRGSFYISSTPLVFTNYYLLKSPNESFVEGSLSLLNKPDLIRTHHYQTNLQSVGFETPLRFIVENKALKWAYWLTLGTLLIFVLFEAKRKQRMIPIINPLRYTTLDFTHTMGRLYFEQGDHANIMDKMTTYLLEDIRHNFFIKTNEINDSFYQRLSKKSGVTESQVRDLFNLVKRTRSATPLTDQNLLELNKKITAFRKAANLNL